jgi:hypothetical protein
MIFFIAFPCLLALLIVIWGIRKIVLSTEPSDPRLKGFRLSIGLVATGVGGTILFAVLYAFVRPPSPRPFSDRMTNTSQRFNQEPNKGHALDAQEHARE